MDGEYPDEAELQQIREWHYSDFLGLMEFVKVIWWMPSFGWRSKPARDFMDADVTQYDLSTGGWSGNESIIEAMKENWMFWSLCWWSSRRGGHYVFQVRPLTKDSVL